MRRALVLARRGWGQTAPNHLVGAVLVRDDEVVGEGFHERFGAAHAELMALRSAGAAARGATAFVTLEPCNHTGKTGPCAEALIAAGVRRVVIAVADPNPVARGGAERLREAGVATEFGLAEQAATDLNAAFLFAARGAKRPWVTLKLAVSRDGAVADASRAQRWITGEASRLRVHRLRAGHDAVAVGIGTVLADDPELTVRHGPRPRLPTTRIVFDRGARLPLSSQLARTAAESPVIVMAEQPDPGRVRDLNSVGVRVEQCTGIADALQKAAVQGVRSLLVEGGAGIAQALMHHNLVDRLIIFQSPVLLGPGSVAAFAEPPPVQQSRVVERRVYGDDEMTEYAIHSP